MYVTAITFLMLLGGAVYYLAHRVRRLIRCRFPAFSIWWTLVPFALLTVATLLSVVRPFGGTLGQVISWTGSLWLGVFIYLLLFTLLSDLTLGIARLCRVPEARRAALRLLAGAGACALTVITTVYGLCHAANPVTVDYTVSLAAAPTRQLNLVMVSDVHLGAVGSEERLGTIVEAINACEPDLICIAGDFFDTDYAVIRDPAAAIDTLRQLTATHGVYACLGNHDAGDTFPQMEAFLQAAGITLLTDSHTVIDGALVLAGRRDSSPIGRFGGLERQPVETALAGADPALPVVMLDHNPRNIDGYRGEADLILSGHTHKGQIFPGSLITDAMYTVDHGYYRGADGTQAIVTSGVGTWGLPMRVGTDSEILRITVKY